MFAFWIYFWFYQMNFKMTNIFSYPFIWLNGFTNHVFICYFEWTRIFHKRDQIIRIYFVSNWDPSIIICYFATFLFAKNINIFFPYFSSYLDQRINKWIIIDFIQLFVSLWSLQLTNCIIGKSYIISWYQISFTWIN